LVDGLVFTNRSVLDDALRRCRFALVDLVRERLLAAYPDDAVERIAADLRIFRETRRNVAATVRSGVVEHQFDDEFDLLEISHIGVLLQSHPRVLLGAESVPPRLYNLMEEVAQIRNANAHAPPHDLSGDDCVLGLVRVARVLREVGLGDVADEVANLNSLVQGGSSGLSAAALEVWSEFGEVLAGEVDLLDSRMWPRHETTLLGAQAPLCPYFDRAVDESLRAACDAAGADGVRNWENRVVVIIGESKSGKTRSLVESLRRTRLADRKLVWLIKPSGGGSTPLSELTSAVLQATDVGRRLLVVIDDIQFHFGVRPGCVSWHDIRRLAEAGVAIAVTSHPPVMKGLGSELPTADSPAGTLRRSAEIDPRLLKLLLDRRIEMTPRLGEEEIERAVAASGLPASRVTRLPESLVASGLVRDKVQAATSIERAVLEAARLLSLASPDGVSLRALASLAHAWVANESDRAIEPEELDEALRWATNPVVGRISILEAHRFEDDSVELQRFRLLDQLREPVSLHSWLAGGSAPLDYADRIAIALRMIDEGFDDITADMLLADAEEISSDPSSIAYLRWLAVSDVELRSAHLERAAIGGNPDAMFDLARRLATDGGPVESVRYWYDSAAAAGVADARIELAELLFGLGEVADGRTILQEEAERGNALAFFPLAEQLASIGQRDAALRWFRLARETGDPRSEDRYRDARLAEDLGQYDDAEELFRLGLEQGDAWCGYGLARALLASGAGLTGEVRGLLADAARDDHPVAALLLAVEEFRDTPSRVAAESLIRATESAEMFEDSEGLGDVQQLRLVETVEQMALQGWGDLGLRLMYVLAVWGDTFGDESGPGPELFDLSPEQYYAAHVRLGDERWLDAAADAGHEPARRELIALYGSDDDDNYEDSDFDSISLERGDLARPNDDWYRDHYDDPSEDELE
jgi:TPR repeat protein